VDSGTIGKAFAVRLSNCFSALGGNQIIRRFGRRILVDRIIFRLLFENGKFGDFSYWKEFQHPHLTDKKFRAGKLECSIDNHQSVDSQRYDNCTKGVSVRSPLVGMA
jgi:hypothetical protein